MTPHDFAAAVTLRLRKRGADFRSKEDVDAFCAKAWTQSWRHDGRAPNPDVWAERFLAEMAPCGIAPAPAGRMRAPGWFSRMAGGVALATVLGAIFATCTLWVVADAGDSVRPGFGWNAIGIVFFWIPGGAVGVLLGACLKSLKVRGGWWMGGCVGGLAVGAWPLLAFLSPS